MNLNRKFSARIAVSVYLHRLRSVHKHLLAINPDCCLFPSCSFVIFINRTKYSFDVANCENKCVCIEDTRRLAGWLVTLESHEISAHTYIYGIMDMFSAHMRFLFHLLFVSSSSSSSSNGKSAAVHIICSKSIIFAQIM